jgi:hypothetical protein
VSGRLAITPGFEAPPVQSASAAGSLLKTAAAQTNSPKAAVQTKVSSVFANLIQELAQEAAPPPATKTTPRAPQQTAPLPGEPALELPAAQSASAQSTVESTPDAPATGEDKPAVAPPAPPPVSSEGTRRQPKSEASGPRGNSAPLTIDAALFMPAAPPISLKLPSFITRAGEWTGDAIHTGEDLPATSTATAARERTLDLRPAPALELKIRAQEQPTAPVWNTTTKPAPTDQQTDTELPSTVTSGTQPHAAEQIVHGFASEPGKAAIEPTAVPSAPTSAIAIPPTPVNPPLVINTNASSAPAPPQAPSAHFADEPVSRQPEQHAQPLRSISLEFAPDGAQDVRVRLAERGGDVHISLHSNDPALSSRLSDGVHELVGTLASAGYDAQAWSQGQGRQNHSQQDQTPPDDPRRNRRGNSADPGTEDFDALVQQPISTKP